MTQPARDEPPSGATGIIRCAALFVSALAALSATPSLARADEASDKAYAQELFSGGNRAIADADYTAALEKFRAAYAAYPSAKILLNIGTTLRLLGRHAKAAQIYEAYIHDPAAEPVRVAELKLILVEIDRLAARLLIHVEPPNATVRLDGEVITPPPDGVRVDAGEHGIVADAPGFLPGLQTVLLTQGEQRQVELRLRRPPVNTVVVNATQRTLGLVLGGVGLVGVLGGLGAGAYSLAQWSTVKQHCGPNGVPQLCDPAGAAAYSSGRSAANGATVALIAGGVVGATGLVIFLTAPKAPRADASPSVSVSVAARANPGSAFVELRGSW